MGLYKRRVGMRNRFLRWAAHSTVDFIAKRDLLFRLAEASLIKLANYLTWRRQQVEETTEAAIELVCPDLVVRHGPFRGMVYPARTAVGSFLFPKLLGSYERELHTVVQQICNTGYCQIVDIGCAEGYYAIGLAMRNPTAAVFAFDIDPAAQSQCRAMAKANGVDQRIVIGDECTAETLKGFDFADRTLVLSDCEGFEKDLFTDEVVARLRNHDVLIEVHDHLDIDISLVLSRRFEASHTVQRIDSVDDIRKAQQYQYDELDQFDLVTRRVILGEHRPASMSWLFFQPRDAPNVRAFSHS